MLVETRGRMTGRDFVAMAGDILRHPRKGGNAVFDHRELDFSGVPLADLEMIRAFHVNHETEIGGGKSAIVVGPGRGREWDALWSRGEKIKTSNRVRVFEDFEEAAGWAAAED